MTTPTEICERASMTYDWNGHTDMPIMSPEKSDFEVARLVRMLMRDQLNHELVCTMARDRIMGLSKLVANQAAEIERLTKERDEARKQTSGVAKALAFSPPYQASLTERTEVLIARTKSAEARALAAEAALEKMREALETIAESHDAGRHDGLPEPCPAHDADTMWAIATQALDALTTQGGGE